MGWGELWKGGPSGLTGGITPGQVITTALWLRADKNVVFGGMAPAVQNAGIAAAVSFTGVPTFGTSESFEVSIDGAGARGVATFAWAHNNVLVASGVLTAATVLLTDGVSVNFPVHVYSVNDDWTDVPAVTSITSLDPSATVFSQATLASMPAWIAPGLFLTGWSASINGQAGLRFAGAQELDCATYTLAQPFTVAAVVTASFAGAEGLFNSTAGGQPYAYINGPAAWAFLDGAGNEFEYYGATIFSPFVMAFTANGNASQYPGSGSPVKFSTAAFAPGTFAMGSLSGATYLTGDICEFWIDGEATPPSTWGQVRQGWVTRYGM